MRWRDQGETTMNDEMAYIERQAQLVRNIVPTKFYDALGPYEGQAFEKTFVNIKDAGLGWLIADVSLIYIDNNDWHGHSPISDVLPMTTWPGVKCSWDPQELQKLSKPDKLLSLYFEIGTDIEFDSVDIDAPNDPYQILDALAEFAMEFIDDEFRDELNVNPHLFHSLIADHPKKLQIILKKMFSQQHPNFE